MKRWFPVLLFLSLSDCNDASTIQSIMPYSLSDNIYHPRLSVKVIDVIQIIVGINSTSSTVTLSYMNYDGFTWFHGIHQSEYSTWLVIPERVSYNGYDIYLEPQSRGSFLPDVEDNDNYHLIKGLAQDEVNTPGRTCFNVEERRSLAWPSGGATLSARFPIDLPKGDYTFSVKFSRGTQRNNYGYIDGRHKIPPSLMRTFPFGGALNFLIKDTGGCRSFAQSLKIDHGGLSIDSANDHYMAQTLSMSCDVSTNIRFFLLSSIAPVYNHDQQSSAGLDHGWGPVVPVSGVDKGETTMRWYRAGI